MWAWAITAVALTGTVLNVKKIRLGFLLWTLSNIYLCIHNFMIQEYAQSLLFATYTGLSVWGFFSWKK